MISYTWVDSPLGRILLTSDRDNLTGLYFEGQKYQFAPGPDDRLEESLDLFQETAEQIRDYFAGTRAEFTIPLGPNGTPFQGQVWEELTKIPYGATTTYGALALALGRPAAARAVGAAVGRNPISIIIPCHRVIGRNGSLTGYAGGLDRKKALLVREQAENRLFPV